MRNGIDEVCDGTAVAFGLRGAAHSAGVPDGSTVTYREAGPAADLSFVAGSDTVKELPTLHDRTAPTEWVFPLALTGLTATLDDSGTVLLTGAEGIVRAAVLAGWTEDAGTDPDAHQGEVSSGVRYVPNLMNTPSGWKNLGTVVDSRTGMEVPTR